MKIKTGRVSLCQADSSVCWGSEVSAPVQDLCIIQLFQKKLEGEEQGSFKMYDRYWETPDYITKQRLETDNWPHMELR